MIKRINPKATFKVIAESDDAIISETADELAALTAAGQKSRYAQYSEKFDESLLKFKDGGKPSRFVLRGLKHLELAEISEKFYQFDPELKKNVCTNRGAMMLAIFAVACSGIEEDGKLTPVTADEVAFATAIQVAALAQNISSLSDDSKNA